MPGAPWNDDDPNDRRRLAANATALVSELRRDAGNTIVDLPEVLRWHQRLYEGCRVPVPDYIGHLRGDADIPELIDYEVGLGPQQPDGLPENVGIWSADVPDAAATLLRGAHAAVTQLDTSLPPGTRPRDVEHLDAVIALAAALHGHWVRIHPFANGNGRTARVWVAWLCARYALPTFVSVKPRPDDIAYARASRASMGRPPDFVGDDSLTRAVFAHMLRLELLG